MKFLRKTSSGFTVLEFLIVLAIIIILVAIALPALERARTRSYNEKIVTDLKSMALGLEQFKQSCGEYPATISADAPCGDGEKNSGITLRNFIPMINDYSFNSPDPSKVANIQYFRFSTGNATFCTGFHIGAQLRNNGTNDSNFDSFLGDMNFNSERFTECGVGGVTGSSGFDGSNDRGIFDIVRQ